MATNNIGVGSNQTVDGLPGNDSIFGTGAPSLNDIIYGHMGNDTINGLAGTTEIDLSTMYGGQSNDAIYANKFDTVYGNLGNDSVFFSGSSTAYGGQGDDSIFVDAANVSNAAFYGNLGDDSLGVRNVAGSPDTLTNSSLYGGQGNDRIRVEGSGNLAHGGLGNDRIYDSGYVDQSGGVATGRGNSTLYGDGGNDVVEGDFNDMIYGNQGNDSLYSESNSSLFGGQGDDALHIYGSLGVTNDLVYGNLGNDILVDHSTAATTVGAKLFGGQGDDTIVSLASNADVMNGGLGNDLFVDSYRTATTTGGHTTTVSDFVTGTDQVSFGSGATISQTTPAPSGNSTNFVAAEDNTVTNATMAAAAASTAEAGNANIHYVFVAGANDGYLFYDGAGGSGSAATPGTFNGEITLTGHNSLTSFSANDITGSTVDQNQGTFLSDVRAKRDITLLGRVASGLNLYRYRYTWSDEVYVGVMAHEVAAVRPDAVVRGQDGLLRVFYDRLGLTLQTWSQWTAARAQEAGIPA